MCKYQFHMGQLVQLHVYSVLAWIFMFHQLAIHCRHTATALPNHDCTNQSINPSIRYYSFTWVYVIQNQIIVMM